MYNHCIHRWRVIIAECEQQRVKTHTGAPAAIHWAQCAVGGSTGRGGGARWGGGRGVNVGAWPSYARAFATLLPQPRKIACIRRVK